MELKEFFRENPDVAVAFSGGVDSSYLLYEAVRSGARVKAYYVKSAFQPEFEMLDAMRLAKEINADLRIIEADILENETVVSNPKDRCYYCKHTVFSAIYDAAEKDGFKVLLDGTNASDSEDDRPGMRALRELKVRSPLRECGLTKDEIRRRSKETGLFTWDKPAYACLATRIRTGEPITIEKLRATEESEKFLFSLGFTDFRVRRVGDMAKLQFPEDQIEKVIKKRKEISDKLKEYYKEVVLDMEVR